jgi:NCAIR mutase (PurE)-related protein
MDHSLDDLLADVAAGRLSAADGAARLRHLGYASVGDFALLDVSRAARKGVPEVVYAEGKSADQVIAIVRRFLEHGPVVLCSRVSDEQAASLAGAVDGTVAAGSWSCAARRRRRRRCAARSACWPPAPATWASPARRSR